VENNSSKDQYKSNGIVQSVCQNAWPQIVAVHQVNGTETDGNESCTDHSHYPLVEMPHSCDNGSYKNGNRPR